MDTGHLHHEIIESFVGRGYAPTARELEERLDLSAAEVEEGLRELADLHGVVLQPHEIEVWIAHPFSATPTPFVVRGSEREWWAPCAWCALGVAALVEEDVEIAATLGSDASPVRLRVRGEALEPADFVVHFATPMTQVWNNVVQSCAMMLLFRNAAEVDAWSAAHRMPRGDVQPLMKVWELARAWYGGHRARDWKKWSASEAAALFRSLGLTGPVWDLGDTSGRF